MVQYNYGIINECYSKRAFGLSEISRARKKKGCYLKPITKEAKTQRGRDRQKTLLDTAINVFLEHGYERASLGKIILSAGGSRSTIYSLYGSKRGLFLACLKHLVDEVYYAYEDFYDEKRGWEEELEVFGNIYLRSILSDKAIGTSRLIFSVTAREPEIGRWYYTEGAQLSYLCFAKVLENKLPLDFNDLKEISLHYIEMLKSDLYHHRLCDPHFIPNDAMIENEVRLCSRITASYIRSLLNDCGSSRK